MAAFQKMFRSGIGLFLRMSLRADVVSYFVVDASKSSGLMLRSV